MDTIEWLRRGLEQPGKTQAELARRLGRDASVVSKILSGARVIKAHEMPIIEAYLDEASPGGRAQIIPLRPGGVDHALMRTIVRAVNSYIKKSGADLDDDSYADVIIDVYERIKGGRSKPEETENITGVVVDFASRRRT